MPPARRRQIQPTELPDIFARKSVVSVTGVLALDEQSTTVSTLFLTVQRVERVADSVVLLSLVDASGQPLPAWQPGAHLDLVLPSSLVRQYSLCGDPADRNSYTVAVLRVADGRGGSIEIHDGNLVGKVLEVHGPRNHFPLVEAEAYLLLAGGIGITPLRAMARELQARGANFALVYGARSHAAMAFADELTAECGPAVVLFAEDVDGRPDLVSMLDDLPDGTAVYCCGPEAMISYVEALCNERAERLSLHFERFAASGSYVAPDAAGERGFELELRRRNIVLSVPPDRTALDVVREVVLNHPYSCTEGICGSCEVAVLAGKVDHRDEVLSAQEQAENCAMMLCVSRALSDRLVIDL
jgi:ferredoxin-NADP reductase